MPAAGTGTSGCRELDLHPDHALPFVECDRSAVQDCPLEILRVEVGRRVLRERLAVPPRQRVIRLAAKQEPVVHVGQVRRRDLLDAELVGTDRVDGAVGGVGAVLRAQEFASGEVEVGRDQQRRRLDRDKAIGVVLLVLQRVDTGLEARDGEPHGRHDAVRLRSAGLEVRVGGAERQSVEAGVAGTSEGIIERLVRDALAVVGCGLGEFFWHPTDDVVLLVFDHLEGDPEAKRVGHHDGANAGTLHRVVVGDRGAFRLESQGGEASDPQELLECPTARLDVEQRGEDRLFLYEESGGRI